MPSIRLRRAPSGAAQMSPSLGTWEGDTLSPQVFEADSGPASALTTPVQAHGHQERRWRLLANTLPQLIWTCRGDGQCDFLSKQWAQYTGLPEVVLLGDGWLKQVHDLDQQGLTEKWQATLAGQSEAFFEFRLRRHDGAYRWFEARVRPVLDGAGQVIKWVGANTDIEERKRAQAEIVRLNAALSTRIDQQASELRQRERDMQAILDNTPSMMGYWDAQLRNRFANRAYHDWLGIDPATMPGMHIKDVIGDARYQANLPYIEAVLRGEPQSFERSFTSADGKMVRHSRAHYCPDIDEQGHVRGFYATINDVTPIKQAQAHVEELLAFIEGVIQHCPVGLAVYQEGGQCVMVNPALAELLQSEVPLLDQHNFRQTPWWRGIEMSRQMDATLADGQTRQIEVAIQVAPHVVRQAMCGLARLSRQGSPHLLIMVQDITSLRQASDALVTARDAADAATRAKGAFLANMSHEIRTPMNAIVGLSRLALEDHLPPKARTYLDKVHQSSMALMGILDDVLDYSKIEAGQMRVEQLAMNLDEVLARSVDLFSARIEQKGLALDVDIAPDVPRQVLGDPLRLSQVINNFLGNAVKFTEAGQIVIRVQYMARTPDQQHLLKFSVTDTGVGIAPQNLGHLFEAFTQADASITRRYGGTGLGLTICKKLVGMMGGHIGVDSQLGHGSSFWFTLALPEAPCGQQRSLATIGTPTSSSEPSWLTPSTSTEVPHRPTQRAWHDRSAPLLGARILLAEDNRLNQIVAQELLSRMGMTVTLAETGEDALRILGEHPPRHFAAVLMDLHMPIMDGLEATRHIRAKPLFAHLPIIAMTASAMPEDRTASLAAGMTDYVTKPVMPDQLLDVLLRRINLAEHSARTLQQPASPGKTGVPGSANVENMAGFDLPALLIRVNGNRGLMWALLHQFACSEAHAGDALARMMAAGDLDGARRKVHDLKGCSGNLGMVDVAQASAELESVLRQGQLDGARLAALQQVLRRSLALIALNLALYEGGTPPTRH